MQIPNDMYIGGQWTPAADGKRLEIINPATEEVVDSVPAATPADLDAALTAADAGWREWREVDAWTRSAALRRAGDLVRKWVDEMAAVLTEEQGKPLAEAKGELMAAADQFDWYADEARRIYGRVIDGHSRDHRLLVIRQPVGPVAAFSPWNFPALLSARKMAPAIAAGWRPLRKLSSFWHRPWETGLGSLGSSSLLALARKAVKYEQSARHQEEWQVRQTWNEAHERQEAGSDCHSFWLCKELRSHISGQLRARRSLRDENAGRGRDDKRRDLADQAIADRQNRVGLKGFTE